MIQHDSTEEDNSWAQDRACDNGLFDFDDLDEAEMSTIQ